MFELVDVLWGLINCNYIQNTAGVIVEQHNRCWLKNLPCVLLRLHLLCNACVFLVDERVGNLVYVTSSPENATNVCSQLGIIVRSTWSNSPAHGCRVVATILTNSALFNEW